jgi:hypothetical protein
MRLDTCLLADAATTTPDGKMFIHGGGITRLTPPTLPWTHPTLTLVLRFELEAEDVGVAHEILLGLESPAGEAMLTPAPTIKVPGAAARAIPGEESYLQTVFQIAGIPIATDGIYRLSVALDGEPLRVLPIAVISPNAVADRDRRPSERR